MPTVVTLRWMRFSQKSLGAKLATDSGPRLMPAITNNQAKSLRALGVCVGLFVGIKAELRRDGLEDDLEL
jgi:hypothetical protein